jgi:hypothetical protein
MLQDLLRMIQEKFGLLDPSPTVYYTLKTNTGLVIQGVIKQYFNQGIITLEGTGSKTISLSVSRYDWTSLDLDSSGYIGPLQIVEVTESNDSVDEHPQPYTYKLVMHAWGQCVKLFIPDDKKDLFYNTVLSSLVEINTNVFRCDGYGIPIEVKNFLNTYDDCYSL